LDLEAEEIEEFVFPILGWVAVAMAAVLILGGVGIGLYLRHRYQHKFYKKKSIPYIKKLLAQHDVGNIYHIR